MGTRADFYVGVGKDARWLGSIAWDGYEWAEDPKCDLMQAATETAFIEIVNKMKESRKDFTSPEQGWPWPWNDSSLTDYAYCYVDGKVVAYGCGVDRSDWPDMSTIQNVTFGAGSGLIVVTPTA